MSMIVQIEGMEKLLAKLRSDVVRRHALAGMEAAVSNLHADIAKYPMVTPGRHQFSSDLGQHFKSDKQRRWFFASLRDGSLQIPYKRVGKPGGLAGGGPGLQGGWRGRWWATGDNIIGEVSNPCEYGPYVQGAEQTPFHAEGGWRTLPAAANAMMDQVKQIFTEALQNAANEMAGGE